MLEVSYSFHQAEVMFTYSVAVSAGVGSYLIDRCSEVSVIFVQDETTDKSDADATREQALRYELVEFIWFSGKSPCFIGS